MKKCGSSLADSPWAKARLAQSVQFRGQLAAAAKEQAIDPMEGPEYRTGRCVHKSSLLDPHGLVGQVQKVKGSWWPDSTAADRKQT